jgi:uncharacterized protein (TIGR02145 family)
MFITISDTMNIKKDFITAILIVLIILTNNSLNAQVPLLINYQARLVNPATSMPVTDGAYTITFSIYDAAAGGELLWTETQSVQLVNGIYSILLGSLNPLNSDLFTGPERYLGVTVGTDPEMVPRKQLVSVPYALHALTAENISGPVTDTSIWKKNADDIYYTRGNVGIGTENPGALLTIEHNDTEIPDHLLLSSNVGQVSLRLDDTGDPSSLGFQFRQVGENLILDRQQDLYTVNSLLSFGFGQYKNMSSWLPLRLSNYYGSMEPIFSIEHVESPASDYLQFSSSYTSRGDVLSIKSMGNIGMGTATPDSSAALEIKSSTQGFLPPRMTLSQRDLISPVEGLIIYNTTTKKPNFFDGAEWKNYDGTSAAEVIVTDVDGNPYHTVEIGTQTWLVENLKTTRLNNGTTMALATESGAWTSLSVPGYCWPGNNVAYKDPYGALYNWYAVNTGILCPTGWHVPAIEEWNTLFLFLGGESVAGGKMKETGTTHWLSTNTGATNESGFTALPAGYRYGFSGSFVAIGSTGPMWSSTQNVPGYANNIGLSNFESSVGIGYNDQRFGISVRCLKNP